MTISQFKKTIWGYYKKYRRELPWREHINPYHVVVSEIMLQQTQVGRVLPKFESFIARFPDFETLANAALSSVLKEWQGLGYNRRGMAMKKLAQIIVEKYKGKLPETIEELGELPNIGPNTAGSILAFAFNKPSVFIETNIRSVFIHFFFKGRRKVSDEEILPLIEKTLPRFTRKVSQDSRSARDWYYALMDYGVYLKKFHPNPSRKSKHYTKQSPFKGSNRDLRARILRAVIKHEIISEKEIISLCSIKNLFDAILIRKNLKMLSKEGFLVEKNKFYSISV